MWARIASSGAVRVGVPTAGRVKPPGHFASAGRARGGHGRGRARGRRLLLRQQLRGPEVGRRRQHDRGHRQQPPAAPPAAPITPVDNRGNVSARSATLPLRGPRRRSGGRRPVRGRGRGRARSWSGRRRLTRPRVGQRVTRPRVGWRRVRRPRVGVAMATGGQVHGPGLVVGWGRWLGGGGTDLGLHGGDQGGAGRPAVVPGLGHGAGDDGVQGGGEAGNPGGDRGWRFAEVGEDHLDVVHVLERHRAGEAVEQDAAQRVDVGAAVQVAALDLLGGHIRDRAHELVGGGQGRLRLLGVHLLDQPEVAQVAVAVAAGRAGGEEDVGRLDVAVDQAAGVGGVQRAGHLGHDGQGPGRLQAALPPQQGRQVHPVDIPHGDVEQPAVLAGLEDRDDARMVDAGRDPRLAQEPPAEGVVGGKLGREHFERDLAAQAQLHRPVDLAHAPAPQTGLDPVAGDLDVGVRLAVHAECCNTAQPADRSPVIP